MSASAVEPGRRRFLLDEPEDALVSWLAERGRPGFHARQVRDWVFERRVFSFAGMTDLPGDLRAELGGAFDVLAGKEVERSSSPGGTFKILLRWPDGASTETVMIPARDGARARRTVCLSTQVGCAVGCRFCASGIGGVRRDLGVGEVMEQALRVAAALDAAGERLSHAVFMGMGEPLANYAVTVEAVRRLSRWLGVGRRRITVSTVGLPRQIVRLAGEDLSATLALSLHAPTAELRRQLIPWAEAIDLDAVLAACRRYYERTGRQITLEYCLLAGVNDEPAHAEQLAAIAVDLRAHVNLMMYNPVAGLPYERPSRNRAIAFLKRVRAAGADAHLRASRGLEADAACGQLRRRHELATR
ncbi:MAG: 23S rRNA (adenine(2503)-C(2))-methyltransferase RlmN [Acidobacteriota bacterium]|nr:23S rRNA (adenine(2503)-C(2))-methyltransferase RlmN [Acidobacteriota bacterium]MDH3523798.1 23S rRNA (adenine(2503)-C(2))-methyltransferase RlmN [Acidobacteriota bacterium]